MKELLILILSILFILGGVALFIYLDAGSAWPLFLEIAGICGIWSISDYD